MHASESRANDAQLFLSVSKSCDFVGVHLLNPSFPLRSAHVAITCQMQKYIYMHDFLTQV